MRTINELLKMFVKIEADVDDLSKDLDKVEEKAEEAADGVVDRFKKAGQLLVGAIAVDKIIDFGKVAVEAAAEANAMEAQFEQTFKGIEKEASGMIDAMSKEFNILPERITPTFTAMSAKFKGLGVDADEAMKMAQQSTTLAADAAAYYDITLEDANSALNSFLNGNTEAKLSLAS